MTDWAQIREFATSMGSALGACIGTAVAVFIANFRNRRVVDRAMDTKVAPVADRVALLERGEQEALLLRIQRLEAHLERLGGKNERT